MKNKLLRTTFIVFRRLKDPYYQGAAAELGFYLLFSIVPIFTLMFQALSFFEFTKELVDSIRMQFQNNELISIIIKSIGDMNGFGIVFLISALWAASKFEFSLIRMANYTYGIDRVGAKGYISTRVRAIITMMALIVAICLGLLVLVYGEMIFQLINVVLEEFLGFALHIDKLVMLLKWPVALVVYGIFIAANYSVLPRERIPLRETVPGSIFASVGIIIVSVVYYVYFNNFASFNMIYGSFAAVVALLLWFYILGYILVLGMVINAVWFGKGDRLTQVI